MTVEPVSDPPSGLSSSMLPADPIASAREALDAHVRHVVNCHFDPEKGTPFWLTYAQKLGFDPRQKINGYNWPLSGRMVEGRTDTKMGP